MFGVFILVLFAAGNGVAQHRPDGRIEIAMLAGLTLYGHESFLNGEPSVGVPVGGSFATVGAIPGVRLTYWTNSFLTVDLGVSFLFEDDPILGAELGIGANLRRRDAKLQPFFSGLAGFWSNLESSSSFPGYLAHRTEYLRDGAYIGGCGGIKLFVRDHATWRLQAGLRHGVSDFDETLLEILTGFGFFL
jgi:hypothetical protein